MCCIFNTTSGHHPAMSTFSFSVKGGLIQTSGLSIPVGTLLCKRARCSHLPKKRKSSLGHNSFSFLAVEFCSLSWLQNIPLTSFMLWKTFFGGEVGASSGMDQKNQTEKPKPKGRNHSLPPPIAKFSRQTEAQLRLRFTSKDQDGVGCFQV